MPQSVLQPVVVCIGENAAGNPTQFLLSAAFQQMGLDWQCITAQVSNEELATAVDGVAAMKMSGVVFLDTLSIPAEHEIGQSIGFIKSSRDSLATQSKVDRANEDRNPETNEIPYETNSELEKEADENQSGPESVLVRISAMRYCDGEFELFDCLPTAIWNTLANQRDSQTHVVTIADIQTYQYFAQCEPRWQDAKNLVLQASAGKNENVTDDSSMFIESLRDELSEQSYEVQIVYLNSLKSNAERLDELKTIASAIRDSDLQQKLSLMSVAEEPKLPEFQTVDSAEVVLQSRIANLCFVAQIQNPKEHGLNMPALREALEEFQQW